jgi:hypothetical protein
VQKISITEAAEAFRRTTADEFDHGVDLLANFGSIEWEFPAGVIGNVFAVYKVGNLAVAVPGFCRDGDRSSTAPLIVPFFEVDRGNLSGATTLFAVRNETDDTAHINYKYLSADGTPLCPEEKSLPLAAHATRTVNLRDVLTGKGPVTGFVQIEHPPGAFSGDFALFDPSRDAAGGALVDTDTGRSPAQLCRLWDTRFLQGEPPEVSTEFIFYLQSDTGAMVVGHEYSETGALKGDITVTIPINVHSIRHLASSLGLQAKSGSIEWDFGDGVAGNVSAVFTRAGGASVLVPGVCRDKDP